MSSSRPKKNRENDAHSKTLDYETFLEDLKNDKILESIDEAEKNKSKTSKNQEDLFQNSAEQIKRKWILEDLGEPLDLEFFEIEFLKTSNLFKAFMKKFRKNREKRKTQEAPPLLSVTLENEKETSRRSTALKELLGNEGTPILQTFLPDSVENCLFNTALFGVNDDKIKASVCRTYLKMKQKEANSFSEPLWKPLGPMKVLDLPARTRSSRRSSAKGNVAFNTEESQGQTTRISQSLRRNIDQLGIKIKEEGGTNSAQIDLTLHGALSPSCSLRALLSTAIPAPRLTPWKIEEVPSPPLVEQKVVRSGGLPFSVDSKATNDARPVRRTHDKGCKGRRRLRPVSARPTYSSLKKKAEGKESILKTFH